MLSVAGAGLPPVVQRLRLSLAAVRDPRGVLKEFGVEIPADVEIRVWIAALSNAIS